MKKKTINLLNSLKTVVETSYPNLPRKIQKQILEDFVYDSMINQLSYLSEADWKDRVRGTAFWQNAGDKGHMFNDMKKNSLDLNAPHYDPDGKMFDKKLKDRGFFKMMDDNITDFKTQMDKEDKRYAGKQKGFMFMDDDPDIKTSKRMGFGPSVAITGATLTTLAITAAALTGWGLSKAVKFVKEKGPEGVEALKDKMKPSMMSKVKSRFNKLKAAVGLAEGYVVKKKKRSK